MKLCVVLVEEEYIQQVKPGGRGAEPLPPGCAVSAFFDAGALQALLLGGAFAAAAATPVVTALVGGANNPRITHTDPVLAELPLGALHCLAGVLPETLSLLTGLTRRALDRLTPLNTTGLHLLAGLHPGPVDRALRLPHLEASHS